MEGKKMERERTRKKKWIVKSFRSTCPVFCLTSVISSTQTRNPNRLPSVPQNSFWGCWSHISKSTCGVYLFTTLVTDLHGVDCWHVSQCQSTVKLLLPSRWSSSSFSYNFVITWMLTCCSIDILSDLVVISQTGVITTSQHTGVVLSQKLCDLRSLQATGGHLHSKHLVSSQLVVRLTQQVFVQVCIKQIYSTSWYEI